MYIGRIVAFGMTKDGRPCAMYRVSSRSFPNRRAVENNGNIAIIPREGAEGDLAKNPYISYNCLRVAGEWAIATNGSQTDPITEKIAAGMPVRDAITMCLLAMDYEKDSLDTPRVVAVVGRKSKLGYLGIVRKDAVLVRDVALEEGKIFHISTYEHNYPCDCFAGTGFTAANADDAAKYVVDQGEFAGFEHPVTSCAAFFNGAEFELAVKIV